MCSTKAAELYQIIYRYLIINIILCALVQVTASMETILEDNLRDGRKQPLLVVLGSRGSMSQVFLVIEGHAIEIRKKLLAGIDKLIKLYFILNIAYPVTSSHIFQFIQRFMMNISDNMTVPRSVLDLVASIKANK